MRALVLGASGQVGAAIVDRLIARGHTVVGTHNRVAQPRTRPLDLTDTIATEQLIAETEPDWVLCPAGLTHVDYCEDHPELAMAVNRDAPAAAAQAAAKRRAGFVFFSTEYVFDGAGGPYAEDDPISPLCVYGLSKLQGERHVQAENKRAAIIRTAGVYGVDPQGKNFVYQVLRKIRSGEPVHVPHDQISTPTYNLDLAAATVELIERDVYGITHLAGPELLDRYAFALEVCAVFGLDPSFVKPVDTPTLAQRARRPLRAGLATDRAHVVLQTRLQAPRQALADMRTALERASG